MNTYVFEVTVTYHTKASTEQVIANTYDQALAKVHRDPTIRQVIGLMSLSTSNGIILTNILLPSAFDLE